MLRGGPGARHGAWACVLGVPHIVVRADINGELGYGVEEVQDVGRVGVGLELAAGGAVRGVLGVDVLLDPAFDNAELVLVCAKACDARWS